MLAKLFALLLVGVVDALAQTPTYTAASPGASPRITTLRKDLELRKRGSMERFWKAVQKYGASLIEPIIGDNL
jgi:hypothetical protein